MDPAKILDEGAVRSRCAGERIGTIGDTPSPLGSTAGEEFDGETSHATWIQQVGEGRPQGDRPFERRVGPAPHAFEFALQPGPRDEPRATLAKGSSRSDQLARQSEAPPDMLLSSSTCSGGNSPTKREGMELVHWP